MFDAIKPLLDAGIINEDTKVAINEAWEAKLSEAKEAVRAELREEFAQRYEHDKSTMVEALDNMVTEALSVEIKEFQDEKQALAEDRVKFRSHMLESAGKFDNFMVAKLSAEIKELREDRKQYQNSIKSLEKFVIEALSTEIKEFEQDKKAVVEARVRLVREGKQKLGQLKSDFIAKSSRLVKEAIATSLETELTQLKEDIQTARENNFGRRLFEAFAGEFAVTHLNENKEIAKLQGAVKQKEQQLKEAKSIMERTSMLVESKEKEIKVIKESQDRKAKLNALLKPLNEEKATIMSELLENVQTDRLQSAFEKYLPAVLTNGPSKAQAVKSAMLTEGRKEVTGDKTTAKVSATDDTTNVIDIKRLAGLK